MNEKLEYIISKLKSVRRLETVYLFLSGLFSFISVFLISLLTVTLFEFFAQGDVVFRTALFFLLIILLLTGFYIFLLPQLLRIFGIKYLPDIDNIALRVGNAYPVIKDKLLNALQLILNKPEQKSISGELSFAYFNDVYSVTKNKDFSKIIKKEKTRKSFYFFLAVSLISLVFFIFLSSGLSAAFERIVNFKKEYIPPAPFSLTIKPQKLIITRGNDIEISVKSKGVAPESVELFIRELQQEKFDRIVLNNDSAGVFTYKISSIKRSIEFYAQSPWYHTFVKSWTGNIQVIERPIIKSLTGKITPPAYTHLASVSFNEKNADISAVKGSAISFTILSGTKLKSAKLFFIKTLTSVNDSISKITGDTNVINLKVSGKKAFGSMRVSSSGEYYFKLFDNNGIDNASPIIYSMIALDDESPEIDLIEPATDVQVSEEALLPILVNISDDFGFSGLYLNYKLIHSKYTEADTKFSKIKVQFNKANLSLQVPYLWDLNKVDIAPEDIFEFYLEVFDNDIVNGPKSAKTRILKVRLPSLDEVLHSADEMQKQMEKKAKELLKKTEDIKKEMQKMNRELMKKPKGAKLDWKEKKKAEDILKKQADLQKQINDLQKQMSKMTKKLEENQAISPETLKKYQELQKLLTQVSSPELQRLQKQFENAMNKMDPQILKRMMENTKFNEEQFRKSIERTIKLLKRLQAEQKADALQKRADELLRKQEELNKKTENTNASDKEKLNRLAKEQRNLKKELDKMAEDLAKLDELMKELGKDMPLDAMENAKQELNHQETASEMNKASSQMQESQMSKASNSQKKATNNLRKFADAMKKLKKRMQNSVNKEAVKKMQKALDNLLELSKQQEALKKQTANTSYNSNKMQELQKKQSQIQEGMKNVANSMMDLSEKSFAVTPEMGYLIGQAMQQMQSAQLSLSNRALSSSVRKQTQAMSSINQAAAQMQSMLSKMKKSGSGSCNNPGGEGEGKGSGSGMSFSQRLREAANKQQGINNGMQQMLGQQMMNGQLSQQQQAELGRIAAEQGRARKALDDLAKEQKQFGGKKKALGDLNKIVKEMDEVISDLKSGNISPETLNKQERILSRLLDASVSMNERDYEKKRESKSAKQFNRKSPGQLFPDDSESRKKAMEDMNRALKQGYTKDYRHLIKKYFESLKNQQIKN